MAVGMPFALMIVMYAVRFRFRRIAQAMVATTTMFTALSLQALGAWHVWQSLAQDDETAIDQCAPFIVSSQSLHPGEGAHEQHPFSSDDAFTPLDPPSSMTVRPAPLQDVGEVILIAASKDLRWSSSAVRSGGGSARIHSGGDAVDAHRGDAWDRTTY